VIVVSDTSSISAMISVGQVELLQRLFREVLIPPAVSTELLQYHAALPVFVRVQAVQDAAHLAKLLRRLDQGEAEAIVLAQEMRADYLLMDEIAGRRVALQEGLRVVGLIGVIQEAKRQRMIESVGQLLAALEAQAGFYVSAELKAQALREAGE
jgi:hypothetical protein